VLGYTKSCCGKCVRCQETQRGTQDEEAHWCLGVEEIDDDSGWRKEKIVKSCGIHVHTHMRHLVEAGRVSEQTSRPKKTDRGTDAKQCQFSRV